MLDNSYYACGDTFYIRERGKVIGRYMLAMVDCGKVALINLQTGGRWKNGSSIGGHSSDSIPANIVRGFIDYPQFELSFAGRLGLVK